MIIVGFQHTVKYLHWIPVFHQAVWYSWMHCAIDSMVRWYLRVSYGKFKDTQQSTGSRYATSSAGFTISAAWSPSPRGWGIQCPVSRQTTSRGSVVRVDWGHPTALNLVSTVSSQRSCQGWRGYQGIKTSFGLVSSYLSINIIYNILSLNAMHVS